MIFVDRTGRTLGTVTNPEFGVPRIGENVSVRPLYQETTVLRARVAEVERRYLVDALGETRNVDIIITVEPVDG